MKRLNPDKLTVEFMPGVTTTEPVLGRKYTLTHSDITAELFLTIGLAYAYDKITRMRDEVLAEWRIDDGHPFLYAYVYVGDYGPVMTSMRDSIFRRELPLALEAIVYGDRKLYIDHPELKHAPIWIHFDATDPRYNKFEYWGTPMNYK